MRRIKKSTTNFVTCKSGKLSYLYVCIIFFFVYGNYFLIGSFYNNILNNKQELTQSSSTKYALSSKHANFINVHLHKIETDKKEEEVIITLSNIKEDITIKNETIESKSKPVEKQLEKPPKILVLVLACNRPSVGRCLDKIFKYKPQDIEMPVVVSQDCGGEEQTASVIKSYGEKLTHIIQPDTSEIHVKPQDHRFIGYYKIARHYKWALKTSFSRWPDVDSVLIVEDDLDIAPDFFDYFLATRPLLDKDNSIFCISAWNDIGKKDIIDPSAVDLLYRTDFFPGLGWLLTRNIWNEIQPKFPQSFWDDWIREPENRKGRACIRPEISRSKTFGRVGVSKGQFFDQHLQYITLNNKPYPFRDYDLSHLLKEKYDEDFLDTVYGTREHSINDVGKQLNVESIRVTYNSKDELDMLARKFGLLADRKAGVPRTAYKGILSFYKANKRIYLAPRKGFNDYY